MKKRRLMMRKRMLVFSSVAIVFMYISAFGFIVDALARAQEEFHETYKLKSGSPVSVENTNGNISVTVWEEDYVDVYAVKKTRKDEDELKKVEIQVSKNDELRIKTHYIKKRAKVSVDYTIKVPKTIKVERTKTTNGQVELRGTYGDTYVKSTNGTLSIKDTDGFIEAYTTNGDINLTGATGIKSARTTNGSINVSFSKLADSVEITTTNGSINLTISQDLDADIDLSTTNGSVKASGISILLDEISKHHITGKLGSGGKKLKAKTVNGGITIYKL